MAADPARDRRADPLPSLMYGTPHLDASSQRRTLTQVDLLSTIAAFTRRGERCRAALLCDPIPDDLVGSSEGTILPT